LGVQDPTQLRPSDYEVSYDSPTTVTVRRISDGTVVVPPGTNMAAPATVAFDGLTLNLASGVPATGNTYLLRPFADGARNMGVSITSPANLAVASPVLVVPATGNSGGLAVQQLARPAGATPPTGWTQSVLAFNAAGQYTVTTYTPAASTSAAVNYVPGEPVVVDGFSITLKGIPANGDSFTVRPPLSPETMAQNAGNAKAILALRDVDSFQGVTLADGYVSVFSNVATHAQSAKFAATFSNSQAESAETMRSGYAGVNLDEEAAKLVQYQQAYQASAKYLQTSQGLFDTLLSSFR
jgi:flagellar hook-associated protein 1 FlgK